MSAAASVIDEEVAPFRRARRRTGGTPQGPMAPLHRINPVRIAWLRDRIAAPFRRTPQAATAPLEG